MPAWLFDFDGTAFETHRPPPGGVGIAEAYELAIKEVLGSKLLDVYQKAGGLRNRAPIEVVRELLPGLPDDMATTVTERVIEAKLSHLLIQIGLEDGDGVWPPPCNGFLEFWRKLTTFRDLGATPTAMVSSGHTEFIRRVIEAYSLRLPDVIVSDDIMRKRTDLQPEQRVKPSPHPLVLAHQRLAAKFGSSVAGLVDGGMHSAVYCGDDVGKDGGMAKAAQMRFGHFNPRCSCALTGEGFQFSSWSWVSESLPLGPR